MFAIKEEVGCATVVLPKRQKRERAVFALRKKTCPSLATFYSVLIIFYQLHSFTAPHSFIQSLTHSARPFCSFGNTLCERDHASSLSFFSSNFSTSSVL